MGLGVLSSVLFKGGITSRLATAVVVCSILEGLWGKSGCRWRPKVSLHCDDVLLIESLVGLARERVQTSSWSPSICN